ncbi:histidine kinase [Aquimarina sp. TRL1]|uniref:tetratricopeptide repeat-containing sensor histidine kinase n=1 Tax=Aquimarina sp. (strain TRL1) TaxID=2736252 RepID=UPI00158CE70E|nr:histidine kinase [Aquimarina sp. TRL1]QKX05806.1 histidine kinase [Aquimarina sp. TRL1]
MIFRIILVYIWIGGVGISLWSQDTNSVQLENLSKKAETLKKKKDLVNYRFVLKQIARLAEKEKKDTVLLEAYKNTGKSFEKNKDSVLHYDKEGKRIADQLGNKKYSTEFTYLIAQTEVERGNYKVAYELFLKAEQEASEKQYSFLPNLQTAFAELHYRMEEYEMSFEKLKKAGILFKKLQNDLGESSIYNNLGILYKSRKIFDSSLYYHQKSIAISLKNKDTVGIAYSYNNMGVTYMNMEKDTLAMTYFEKALHIKPDNPTHSLISNYGTVMIKLKKYEVAERFLEEVLNTTYELQLKVTVLGELQKIQKKRGAYKKALYYANMESVLKDQLMDDKKFLEISKLKASYELKHKNAEIAHLKEKNKYQELANRQNRILIVVLVIGIFLVIISGFLYTRSIKFRDLSRQLSLQQRLLRSQMNPHFLFNSMAAIQTFILRNENKKAASYLAKFSKLMRVILENSREDQVNFKTELYALEAYLSLQKLRFQNRLQYEIIVDDELEEGEYVIPPMLFQPFVENAIEHGFSGDKEGLLTITFSLREKTILCTVRDNGIGYSKTKKNKGRKSLSMAITRERLEIFSKKIKKPLHLVVEDRGTEEAAKGTIVKLDIPIITI